LVGVLTFRALRILRGVVGAGAAVFCWVWGGTHSPCSYAGGGGRDWDSDWEDWGWGCGLPRSRQLEMLPCEISYYIKKNEYQNQMESEEVFKNRSTSKLYR
jgi:hypothetical protein